MREETARDAYGAVRVYSDTDCGRTLVIRIIRPIGKFGLSVTFGLSRGKIRYVYVYSFFNF